MLESALTKTGFCSHAQSLIKFHLQKPVPGNVQVLQHQLKLDLALNQTHAAAILMGTRLMTKERRLKVLKLVALGK